MADLSLLLQALANKQGNYLAENPWYTSGQAIMKTPVYATEDSDPLQTALAQALSGFIGGAVSAYGKSQATDQGNALVNQFTMAAQQSAEEGGPNLSESLLANPETKEMASIAAIMEAIEQNKVAELRQKYELESEYAAPKDYQYEKNGEKIYERYDPKTRTMQEIGRSKDAPDGGIYGSPVDPQTAAIIAKKRQGAKITPEEELFMAGRPMAEQSLYERASYREDVQGRHETNIGLTKKKAGLMGYEPLPDAPLLSSEQAGKLRDKIGTTQLLKDKLLMLAESNNINALVGPDAAMNEATAAMIFQAFRGGAGGGGVNSGANLTKNEQAIINAMAPKIAAGDLGGAIKAGLLGRDQKTFSRDLASILQKDLDIEVLGEAGWLRKGKKIEEYPAHIIESLGITPPNWKEDPGFKAWKESQGK